jgi:hypothetical protein
MAMKSFSVVTSYRVLNEITGKLNGANKHSAGSLNGMFFRRQDFESSTQQLMRQLHAERIPALSFVERGFGDDDFRDRAKKDGVRIHSRTKGDSGNSSFDTYDLSPSLRHFLNDYCRILEPLTKLLAQKHTSVSAQNTRKPTEIMSFNSYIKQLDKNSIKTPLDHDYFIKLYDELWNDYKHAESSGVQASGWSSDDKTITSEPKLHSNKLVYFKDMLVKDFIEKSLKNMNDLLDYIA